MKKIISFGFIVFILSAFIVNGSFAQNRKKQLEDFFSALARNQDFDGNILVAEKGSVVYEKSFGYADFPSRKLNTKNSLFPTASISKTITATAIGIR